MVLFGEQLGGVESYFARADDDSFHRFVGSFLLSGLNTQIAHRGRSQGSPLP